MKNIFKNSAEKYVYTVYNKISCKIILKLKFFNKNIN